MDPRPGRPSARPQRAAGAAEVLRTAGRGGGAALVELRPTPAVRVVGPGRRERAYLRRIEGLEQDLTAASAQGAVLGRELETARLVERGTGRIADRLERTVAGQRAELGQVRAQGHRLLVALGALQRENEGLREELSAARRGRLAAARRSWWGRLVGR